MRFRFLHLALLPLFAFACLPADPEGEVSETEGPADAKQIVVSTAPETLDPTILNERRFGEAPLLAQRVKAGKLPDVSDRLPENPLVIVPLEETGRYGGVIRRALTGDIIQTPGPSKTLNEGLMGYERPLANSIEHNLAESYEFRNGGKEVIFRIRKGIRWSDGHPFTVDDILFWYYDTQFDDDARPPNQPIPPTVFTVDGEPIPMEKVDDHTLRVSSHKPLGRILNAFCADIVARPKHVMATWHPRYNPEATYEAFREKTTTAQLTYQPGIPKISAWIPVEWIRGQRIVYERNPYYWKVDSAGNQLPYVDRLEFTVIADPQVILLKFMNGELDLFGRYSRIDMYPTLKAGESDGDYELRIAGPGSGPCFYLNWDADNPNLRLAFRSRSVRIALSHAINREEVSEIAYHGLLAPTGYSFGSANPFSSEEALQKFTRYDPDFAKRLLDEAGHRDNNGDGWRDFPNGERFEITIDVVGPGASVDVCEIVQAHWQAVGVKVNLNVSLRDIIWPRRLNGEFDIHYWGQEGPEDPLRRPDDWATMAATTPFWHRDASKHRETTWLNEATSHIKAAMTSVDPAELREHMETARDLHTDNIANIVVGAAYSVWGASTKLGNVPKEATTGNAFRSWSRPIFHEQLFFREDG
jgi:peptide/nickel transport system substrate-binding protein